MITGTAREALRTLVRRVNDNTVKRTGDRRTGNVYQYIEVSQLGDPLGLGGIMYSLSHFMCDTTKDYVVEGQKKKKRMVPSMASSLFILKKDNEEFVPVCLHERVKRGVSVYRQAYRMDGATAALLPREAKELAAVVQRWLPILTQRQAD